MSYELPPLNWLRAFEAAARRSSFTAAAEELHLTQPAVSYQIRSLEERLGFSLFERYARSVELTDMGLAYLPAVRQAFSQLSAATGGIFGVTGERTVTVRSTATFATLWLAPRLARFKQANPNIDVRLYTAIWADALTTGQADLEIRYGDGHWEGYEVTLLRSETSLPVCSPSTAAAKGPDASISDFADTGLIRIMGCENFWDQWFRTAGIEQPPAHRGITVDNSLAALEVAASGYGLALVLQSFAAPYLDSGRVVIPLDHQLDATYAHYLLMPHHEGQLRPEVLVFKEWLEREARKAG